MRLDDKMRFPHPVLREDGSDYLQGSFLSSFRRHAVTNGELRLTVSIDLDCDDLRRLVSAETAQVGVIVVCRRTYYNELRIVPLGESEQYFSAAQFFGQVTLRAVAWTTRAIPSFASAVLNTEYGRTATFPKATVLAQGPEFSFSMDRQRLKPFDSIFSLSPSDRIGDARITVDAEGDRVAIIVSPRTYERITAMRALARGRDLLMAAVYLPALMEVLGQMQEGRGNDGSTWSRVIEGKCHDLGIDPRASGLLEVAQRLLRDPFLGIESMMEGEA